MKESDSIRPVPTRKTGARELAAGLLSMTVGTVVVVGTLLTINRMSEAPDREQVASTASFAVEKKQPPPPPPRPEPQRQPPKRSSQPAAPMVSLDSSLSGIDFGLPVFDAAELNDLQDQLLGDTRDVVMTDDSVDNPPRPTYQAPMQYPRSARAGGVEGYVVLSLLISATGEIEKVQVLESQPSGVFEDAALQGVRDWQFQPAQYQGRNVRVWARQKVRFDLS